MKRILLAGLSALMLVSVFFAGSVSTVTAKESKILEFDSMVGVPKPYTGATNAIRGIPGGGLPWVVRAATGELKSNGKLEVKVVGLVFDPNDPDVIARGIGGTNTIPNFKAIVSCLSRDADGNPTTVNVSTDPFPASPTGNAKIETRVDLPTPCIAPIIFVTSPTGAWFAVAGS